jgi:hypothetical protein
MRRGRQGLSKGAEVCARGCDIVLKLYNNFWMKRCGVADTTIVGRGREMKSPSRVEERGQECNGWMRGP